MDTLKIAAITKDSKVFGMKKPGDAIEDLKKISDDLSIQTWTSKNIQQSNWWYLHGDLQGIVGFDGAVITNLGEIKTIRYNGNYFEIISIPDGIYDVEVFGIDIPCVGYFWNDRDMLRGLVCLKTDFESCRDAYQKYINRSLIL